MWQLLQLFLLLAIWINRRKKKIVDVIGKASACIVQSFPTCYQRPMETFFRDSLWEIDQKDPYPEMANIERCLVLNEEAPASIAPKVYSVVKNLSGIKVRWNIGISQLENPFWA